MKWQEGQLVKLYPHLSNRLIWIIGTIKCYKHFDNFPYATLTIKETNGDKNYWEKDMEISIHEFDRFEYIEDPGDLLKKLL